MKMETQGTLSPLMDGCSGSEGPSEVSEMVWFLEESEDKEEEPNLEYPFEIACEDGTSRSAGLRLERQVPEPVSWRRDTDAGQ
mgnify:CR=1 FL=1